MTLCTAQSDNSDSDDSSFISIVSASNRDEAYESFEDQGDKMYDNKVVDEFVSSRPQHSARKSIKTVTRINLSSGRCLNLTFVDDKTSSIQDVSTPSTRPKLSVKQGRPKSVMSDTSKISKMSNKSKKSRKSDKS